MNTIKIKFFLPYDHHYTRFTNNLIASELVKLEQKLTKLIKRIFTAKALKDLLEKLFL